MKHLTHNLLQSRKLVYGDNGPPYLMGSCATPQVHQWHTLAEFTVTWGIGYNHSNLPKILQTQNSHRHIHFWMTLEKRPLFLWTVQEFLHGGFTIFWLVSS